MEQKFSENSFVITDLETLRVYADPVRVQIIELLTQHPQTVREMAEKLGLLPSKLYYHINLLEKHALIQVVETRQVANLIEKQYAAAAARIEVDPRLMVNGPAEENTGLLSVVQSTIDLTREDLLRSLQARHYNLQQGEKPKLRELLLNRTQAYLTDERAAEFYQRLYTLIQDLEEADLGAAASQREDVQFYTLMATWYPNFYFNSAKSGEAKT